MAGQGYVANKQLLFQNAGHKFLKPMCEDPTTIAMNFLAWLEVVTVSLYSFREQTHVISLHFFLDQGKILAIT